jgi:hypothetical protein
MNIETLKNKFTLVSFSLVDHMINPRNEDAHYPLGAPKPERLDGEFIRMQNPMGGADTVPVSNVDAILRLAEWHQSRAEAKQSSIKE